MPSCRSLFTSSLLMLIFPLSITAQGYDFGLPLLSLPTSSDPAQPYKSQNSNPPQGSYDANTLPNQGVYGWDPSPSPTDPGIDVAPPHQYVSKPPSWYTPYASEPSDPVYGPPPSDPTSPSYIPPASYGNGIYPGGPIISFPTSSTFSTDPLISNSTIPTGGATTTASAKGAFSSLTSLSTIGSGFACLTQPTSTTTVTHTCIYTITSVLTEVTTETVTLQTGNLVVVPVVSSSISSLPTFSPAPTTLQMSILGATLNSSSTIQNKGGALSTATWSSPTGGVGLSVHGSPLSYASPTPWGTYGNPSGYGGAKSGYNSQPPTYSNGGDDDNGYGPSPDIDGEEGGSDVGSGSDGDSGDVDEGDGETGSWGLDSAPDSEEGGGESEEQSGGNSFPDWLLGSLK